MEALWHPSAKQLQESNLAKYRDFLYQQHDIRFEDYHELWKWSVENVDLFWESIWKYFQVKSTMPYEQILSGNRMPGATWFEGSKLNYAQHIFSQSNAEFPAFISLSEHRDAQIVTWNDLENQVASLQSILKAEQIVKRRSCRCICAKLCRNKCHHVGKYFKWFSMEFLFSRFWSE